MTRDVESPDEEESTTDEDGSTGRVDRRDYLRALGGLGIGGLGTAGVGALTGTASAQTAFDESAADARIRDTQTGPLTVEVVDESGTPVSDASVGVEMTDHDFDWGTMINVGNLLDRFGEGSDYRQHLQELFNTAVLENAHKWAIWSGNTQRADQAVDWLDERGFRIRGHTCVYGVDYAIPNDVLTAAQNGDGQTVRDRTMEHLRDIVTHYGDQIQEWDVVNEAVHRGKLQQGVYSGVNPDDPISSSTKPWTTDLLADWYREAESVIAENGYDVEMATNDFNTMTWDQDEYYEQVQFLLDEGIDLDAIGHQTHLGSSTNPSGQSWTYSTINDVFERFAPLDANQRITEFDMAGDGWSGQQQRAEAFRAFLKTAYGHPDVDQFVIWGMWDETHWRDEAPFFEEDWSEKPALDVWRNLVLDEWWTDTAETTGEDGTATVEAFLGAHEVRVETNDGTTVTETVSVTDSSAGEQITVTVDVPTAGGPDWVSEPAPTDPDGDDLYEDVSGDGDLNFPDVNRLFQNTESAEFQDNAEYLDFDGDGDVDMQDVLALFEEV